MRASGPVEALLHATESLAFARFTRDGVLVDSNPRFRQVCQVGDQPVTLPDLVVEGQRAEMARLLQGGDIPGQRRNVHFAAGLQVPVSLLVSWAWDGDGLLLIGEQPFTDDQATAAALARLTSRIAELARENAKKNAQLQQALEDLQQAQTMLVHREKMAALGQMTAGVAHELNTPLAYVKNNVHLLGEGIEALLGLVNLFGEDLDAIEAAQPELFEMIMDRIEVIDLPALGVRLPELLESIDNGVQRAGQLVAGLRTFSRVDEAENKTVDLNESLSSVVEVVGFLARQTDTALTVDWGDLPPVTCSPGHLNQAVLNMLTNAIQASSPGGKVSMSTRLADREVLITIADDGPGVPEGLADRIFDPFFTTRPVGEGTGLGLSIAHTIVAAHGGNIVLERPDAGGAAFVVHLPLAAGVLP
ncbi:MAG: ATP-binding protein [Actinomycetes bacterium]